MRKTREFGSPNPCELEPISSLAPKYGLATQNGRLGGLRYRSKPLPGRYKCRLKTFHCLSGVQSPYFYQDTITFSDATSQTIDIPGTDSGSSGAVDFVGFTDAGASITSVSINSGVVGPGGYGDYIGVDDVNFQVTTTPEPGSFALVLTGILAIGCERLRRRRRV